MKAATLRRSVYSDRLYIGGYAELATSDVICKMHKHSMKTEKRVSLRQSDREREIDIEREIEGRRAGGR